MKIGLYLATQFTAQTPLGPQLENLLQQDLGLTLY